MRVLHLYAGNLYGGVERLLVTLARERGHCAEMEPHFGLCFNGQLSEELRSAGVSVYMLGQVRFSRPWSVWRARRNLAELLRLEQFDAVICHSCWPHAIFAPVVRSANVLLIFWAHDVPKGTHWLERHASRTPPDLVLANSGFTLAALPNLFPTSRASVLYCPVPLPENPDMGEPRASGAPQEVRDELGTAADAVVIAIACRLEQWKGHRLLLEALGLLRESTQWECWVIGGSQRSHEKTYLDELQRLAHDQGISSRVKFLGQRSDVPRLFAAADIHCQPNTGPEPFGIAFVEALAAGLAVVTTNIGAAPEIVSPVCGFLVPPDDALTLAHTLGELVRDEPRRKSLRANAPARARELCDPASRLSDLYKQIGLVQPVEAAA